MGREASQEKALKATRRFPQAWLSFWAPLKLWSAYDNGAMRNVDAVRPQLRWFVQMQHRKQSQAPRREQMQTLQRCSLFAFLAETVKFSIKGRPSLRQKSNSHWHLRSWVNLSPQSWTVLWVFSEATSITLTSFWWIWIKQNLSQRTIPIGNHLKGQEKIAISEYPSCAKIFLCSFS